MYTLVDMKRKEYKKEFNDVYNEHQLILSSAKVFSKWKRTICDFKQRNLICPETRICFKAIIGCQRMKG